MRKRRVSRTEWPAIMTGPDVRAILTGTKTQFRRLVLPHPPEMPAPTCHPNHQQRHPQPYLDSYCGRRPTPENPRGMSEEWLWWQVDDRACDPRFKCPFGAPGDTLWVRETWANDGGSDYYFRADGETHNARLPWHSPVTMPRAAARILLKVEQVRIQHLHDITEDDARAEGVPRLVIDDMGKFYESEKGTHRTGFAGNWMHKHGATLLESNPFVWAVTFRRIGQNVARAAA